LVAGFGREVAGFENLVAGFGREAPGFENLVAVFDREVAPGQQKVAPHVGRKFGVRPEVGRRVGGACFVKCLIVSELRLKCATCYPMCREIRI
jgi:hypothetical protein